MKYTKKPELHFKDGAYIIQYTYEGQNGKPITVKKEFTHLHQATALYRQLTGIK